MQLRLAMAWPLVSAFPRKMLKNLQNQETMEFLHQSLLTVAAVADDAQENLFATTSTLSNNMVEWLCHFQDIMYLLDELLCKFDSGKAIATTVADAKREVEFVLRRFETISNQKHLLFLTEKQDQLSSSPSSQNLRRDKEMNEMVDLLLSDRENTPVIAMVGAAWTGRDTLANLVYYHGRVKACFELRGWVDFQWDLDSESLAKITLDSFNQDFHYDESLPELIDRLHKCLQGKKILLVLNGFRNLSGWESLRSCFSDAAGKGSAIILTTSELDVAFEMLSDHILSLEDSLFDLVDEKIDPQGFPIMWTGKSLYHLVRLEIVGSWISYLPDEIGELRFLEYIDLSFSEIRALPDSIGMLSRLETLKLAFCCYLRELPSTMEDLVNLRYLDLMGTKLLDMSLKLASFNNLQTLIGFTVNMNSGENLTELATISDIQMLSITELQNIVEARNAAEAELKEKRRLEDLVLRWNQLRFAECEHALEYLEPPKQLKVLEISGCPDRRFPNWLGDASFANLKVICIYDCKNCEFLPPLGQLSSLEELYIRGCGNVRSVGNEFYGQCSLHVPFKSLKILWFVDMPSWKEWILLDDESLQFPCLRELYLIQCPQLLQDLPNCLPSLKKLEIFQCDRLVSPLPKIPHQVHDLMEQKEEQEQGCTEILATSVTEVTSESSSHHATIIMPPVANGKNDELVSDDDGGMVDFESSFEIVKIADASELCNLTSRIKSLRIEGCQFLESLPDEFLKDCSNIRELFFIDCYSLKNFSDVLHPSSLRTIYIHKCPNLDLLIPLGTHKKFAFLEYLCISSSCESLASISINLFPRLRTLYIKDCPKLELFSIAEELRDRNLKLESLEIRDCPNLISFPETGLPTPYLKSISISNCRRLKSLPNHLAYLTSLQSLLIDKCPELESFPEGGLPSSLSLLSITFSDKLAPQKEWKLDTLPSLTHFEIESGCIGMKSFPDKDFLPRNLRSLRMSKLLSLRILNGTGFQHLTALETLEINCCHGLYSLPEGLPSSLTRLCIKESPILSQKLLHRAGAEWSKIAYIPNLQIDEVKKGEIPEQKQKFGEKRFVTRSTYLEGGKGILDGESLKSQKLDQRRKRMPMVSDVSYESDWSKIAHTSNLQIGDGIKEGSIELEASSLKGESVNKDEKSFTSQQWDLSLVTKKRMPPTLKGFYDLQPDDEVVKKGRGGRGRDHDPARLDDTWTSSMEAEVQTVHGISKNPFSHITSKGKDRYLEDFTLQQLLELTENFSEDKMIGRGGFGSVYHATLQDGKEVAIKRAEISPNYEDEKEYGFVNELQIHSRLHHNNLVGLLGFCRDTNERILVYEYMNNGSLHDHLHSHQTSSVLMSWPARIKVALDAARGIEYLHHYAAPPIIHRDIKSSNILLDSKWTGKLCDFGISLKGPEDEDTHLSVEVAGTPGYLDPEYYITQRLTTKSDVYSFGVVLLEILTGRKVIHRADDGERIHLASFAVPYIDQDEIFKVLDPRMPPPKAAEEYVGYLAAECVRAAPRDRPTMAEVVIHLERALAACLAVPAI
ncbi:Serine/threonine-protein kinase-like protein [Arachis hypogaea]|uniref:non-specific serine/threonine protein kinase n=2 Tax=Arachis hypogaea TaxID=3818 RepID=A0A445E213_ARAHY|nr:uncharacterized protein LOC112772801 [Arachis hypogaea]QHO55970.1 Serine/threonine-protein kinase-like protein [Arachis hypogaea]RYR69391.1 hypothetical protein Ahy_A03g015943 isoform D [Arachis hypogaea]